MFEGWVADLIASTLGSYLDLTKDRLRISLWEGDGNTTCIAVLCAS
jgi:hypothetical protein